MAETLPGQSRPEGHDLVRDPGSSATIPYRGHDLGPGVRDHGAKNGTVLIMIFGMASATATRARSLAAAGAPGRGSGPGNLSLGRERGLTKHGTWIGQVRTGRTGLPTRGSRTAGACFLHTTLA